VIAIDPGYATRGRGCACAHFVGGRLVAVWFDRPEDARTRRRYDGVTRVVWECPQVDARTRVSVPAVVRLAAVGGTLAGLYAGASGAVVEAVAPSAWKGSTAKPVAHGRMWAALDARERGVLGGDATAAAITAAKRAGGLDRWSCDGASYYPAGFTMHNTLDAVGIGIWRLGRGTEDSR